MYDGIRLIYKPSKPQICQLICAVTRGNLNEIVKQSCYKIENCSGIQFDVYARSDEDFYKKLIRIGWDKTDMTTNPTFF